jgi:lysophospholipase L1-like esterase
MKYFSFYIIVLIFLIVIPPIFSQYQKKKSKIEGMKSNEHNVIILLGDSILKNNYYVGDDKSVEELLKFKSNDVKIINLAVNDSKIYDLYSQVNKIPIEFNNSKTSIFISVGGNDILDKYVERKNQNLKDGSFLNTFLGSYKKLIKLLKKKMNKCRIILLDVYYPTSALYLPYKDLIKEWNTQIYNYAKENKIDILKISEIVTKSNDFIFDIEPSENGGEKIAEAILNF